MTKEEGIRLSLGFNPRCNVKEKPRPEGAADELLLNSYSDDSARMDLFRPFRAGRYFGMHLGLKPQAESFNPFGIMRGVSRSSGAQITISNRIT